MSWWRRLKSRSIPIFDEHGLRGAASKTDEEKEAWHRSRMERMKNQLDPAEVAEIESASDEENEAALAEEIRRMKRRNPHEWELLLASLPKDDQDQLREIERRYGV